MRKEVFLLIFLNIFLNNTLKHLYMQLILLGFITQHSQNDPIDFFFIVIERKKIIVCNCYH